MNKYVENVSKKVDVWKYKKYPVKVKILDIRTGKNIILLNEDEAKEHDIYAGYRALLKHNSHSHVVIVDVSNELIKPGEVGVYKDLAKKQEIREGEEVEIVHMDRPASIAYIKKKLDNGTLTKKEIETIVQDVLHDRLSEIETTAWITSVYINGFSDEEIIALTDATVDSGDILELPKDKPVLDKHSIGGVAGNRTTMVIVPIIAAAGFYIPKTSSRSITSAAGTADTMEVLCNVTFGIDELKEIVLKCNGAIAWGGGMNLAPVDDKLIRVRRPLSLDPEGFLLASILAKKKSVSAKYVIIDIPVGRGVKVPYVEKGQQLAEHFIKVGSRLGMKLEGLITDGSEPIGWGVGPVLECKDVLNVLAGQGPSDLRHKSLLMAGKLLELTGKVAKDEGYAYAAKILDSGKALAKFKEIIELQGGDPNISAEDLPFAEHKYTVTSKTSGSIFHIDNKTIAKLAKIAGAPRDKGAGVLLHKSRGDKIKKGDPLFTIYSESESKLDFALKALKRLEPVEMRKILLNVID